MSNEIGDLLVRKFKCKKSKAVGTDIWQTKDIKTSSISNNMPQYK